MSLLFPVVVIGLFIAVFIWYLYNDLVSARLQIQEAWSQIDVQLKRRADLIPNLVETVKGYAKHESTLFAAVTAARSALLTAKHPKDATLAEQDFSSAIKSLFAVVENYPQLQASESFQALQRELADTEDNVAYARQFYNTAVLDYNKKLQMVPGNYLAKQFNFRPAEFFGAHDEERKAVEVTF